MYNRMQMMGDRAGTVMAGMMKKWDLMDTVENPTNKTRISTKMEHIRQYATDMAYVPSLTTTHNRKTFKKEIYDSLTHMETNKHKPPDLRIVKKFPPGALECQHSTVVPEKVKSAWYTAIHGIVHTNDRLAAIHMMDSMSCSQCEEQDSIQHKINECG
jgi:hypothetical protein